MTTTIRLAMNDSTQAMVTEDDFEARLQKMISNGDHERLISTVERKS